MLPIALALVFALPQEASAGWLTTLLKEGLDHASDVGSRILKNDPALQKLRQLDLDNVESFPSSQFKTDSAGSMLIDGFPEPNQGWNAGRTEKLPDADDQFASDVLSYLEKVSSDNLIQEALKAAEEELSSLISAPEPITSQLPRSRTAEFPRPGNAFERIYVFDIYSTGIYLGQLTGTSKPAEECGELVDTSIAQLGDISVELVHRSTAGSEQSHTLTATSSGVTSFVTSYSRYTSEYSYIITESQNSLPQYSMHEGRALSSIDTVEALIDLADQGKTEGALFIESATANAFTNVRVDLSYPAEELVVATFSETSSAGILQPHRVTALHRMSGETIFEKYLNVPTMLNADLTFSLKSLKIKPFDCR